MTVQRGSFHSAFKTFIFVSVLAVLYMGISTGLITFNKHLMHPERFPFAMAIGIVQMTSSFSFNAVLLHLCPSLYPSLTEPEQKVELDRGLLSRILLPIATCFAAQICLSNMAFMHSSVSMLQMMKQSNVVLVYFFSLVLSLETFCKKRAAALGLIFFATMLTIHGETNFCFTGFALQGIGMFCESMKLTLQSHSLSATGRRLDAFTYVMLIAPLVLLVLVVWLLAFSLLWPNRPEVVTFPPWERLLEFRWLLAANGCLAFAFQVAHAAFMKNSSAITFILTGVVMKDVMIVAVCAIVLQEELSAQQVIGFTLQLVGVLVWSFLKAAPNLSPQGPLPRGSTGLISVPPEREALRSASKEEDLLPETFKCFLPRVQKTNSGESTMAPQEDSCGDDDASEMREMYEGI